MKKALFLLMAVLFAGSFWVQSVFAGAAIDEEHTAGGSSTVINQSLGRFAQSFKLHYTRLDKVEIELSNVGAGQTLTVQIRHKSGTFWDEGNVAIISNQAVGDGWNTFDFPDIAVLTGEKDSYGIWVTCTTNNVQWKYKEPGAYDRGFAIWQSSDEVNMDWNFKAWGYDPTEIIEEQNNPGSDQDPEQTGATTSTSTSTSTSIATGEAPATTVSTSIVKPSDLTATYTTSANLTWKASTTTDIDGYVVFRSETKGKSYTKIGQTTKTVLTYTDATAEASKTYYYVVRAYKGTSQSASSNEASLAIPATAGPTVPQNLKIKGIGSNYIGVKWDKNPEANISGYELTIAKGEEKIETVQVNPEKNSHVFKGLNPITEYTITLSAKNSDDKQSEAATLKVTTLNESDAIIIGGFELNTLSWCMLGASFILLALLVVMIIKRHKKSKKPVEAS